MTVLMVGISRNSKGGISTVVNDYFKSRLLKEVKIKYIATNVDGLFFKRILFNIVGIMRILFCIIFGKIDIVHVHMAARGSFYRKSIIVFLGKIFRKKTIIHLHGADFEIFYNEKNSILKKRMIKKVFQSADKVIVLSEEWKEKINSWFTCNLCILHNSVFIPERNIYNVQAKYITMNGRLGQRKGTYDVLKIIKEITDIYENIKFLLCGDGEIEKVKKIIKQYGIEDRVYVTGWIDESRIKKIFADTIIYILPSYNEGMPMSVLEAMSYGIPSISTDVGGTPQIIDDNVNGYIIHPGDINALKNKIEVLIDDCELRKKFSKNAYMKIKRNFGMDNHIDELIKIYESL